MIYLQELMMRNSQPIKGQQQLADVEIHAGHLEQQQRSPSLPINQPQLINHN